MHLTFVHGGPGFKDYLKEPFQNALPGYQKVFYTQLCGPEVLVDDLVRQLEDKVESCGGPVCLIAHSWGAYLSLELLSKKAPASVKGIVLLNMHPSMDTVTKAFLENLSSSQLENPTPIDVMFTDKDRSMGIDLFTHNPPDQEFFNRIETNYMNVTDHLETFRRLQIPVHLITGESDLRVSARLFPELIKDHPGSVTLDTIAGAGHFPFLAKEDLEQTCQSIESFLKTLNQRLA